MCVSVGVPCAFTLAPVRGGGPSSGSIHHHYPPVLLRLPALVGAAVVLDHSGASVRILAAYSRHICELGHIGDARLRRVGILACAAPLLYERALDERAPFCYSLAVRLSAAAAG